jgi:hypothetical protein
MLDGQDSMDAGKVLFAVGYTIASQARDSEIMEIG